MRALHINHSDFKFLTEGLMTSNEWIKDKYWPQFLENLAEGQPFAFNIDKDNVKGVIVNGPEVAEKVSKAFKHLTKFDEDDLIRAIRFDVEEVDDENELTGETYENVKLTQIFKDEKIKGEMKPNLGNIAELVLGCAVTAKFEKVTGDITIDDLIGIGQRLANGQGRMETNAGKDSLTFEARVPFIDRKAFYAYIGSDSRGKTVQDYGIPKDTLDGIKRHMNSAVIYANTSERVASAIAKASEDPSQNEVTVKSEGGNAENQKITKVDLKILFDGKELNLLSIKAGRVKQFGQVSGYEFANLNSFFEQTLGVNLSDRTAKKFQSVELGLSRKERKQASAATRESNFYEGAFETAYIEATKQLKNIAKTNEADLVTRVYNGLLLHATRSQEGVEMVILNPNAKKAFTELTFGPELKLALDQLRMHVEHDSSPTAHVIRIYGVPLTNKARKIIGTGKEMLIQLRSYAQKGAVRNIVEMGDLLKDLADLEKIKERKAKVQPAVAPTLPAPEKSDADQTTGLPSKMTPSPEPNAPVLQQPDELASIRKNAGITV